MSVRLIALAVFLVVGTVVYIFYFVVFVVVFLTLCVLAVAWAWNRTTEGHHYHWEANGRPTLAARLDARFRGAPVGRWDDDADVMAHYPRLLEQRRKDAEEAAARALEHEPGTGGQDEARPTLTAVEDVAS